MRDPDKHIKLQFGELNITFTEDYSGWISHGKCPEDLSALGAYLTEHTEAYRRYPEAQKNYWMKRTVETPEKKTQGCRSRGARKTLAWFSRD